MPSISDKLRRSSRAFMKPWPDNKIAPEGTTPSSSDATIAVGEDGGTVYLDGESTISNSNHSGSGVRRRFSRREFFQGFQGFLGRTRRRRSSAGAQGSEGAEEAVDDATTTTSHPASSQLSPPVRLVDQPQASTASPRCSPPNPHKPLPSTPPPPLQLTPDLKLGKPDDRTNTDAPSAKKPTPVLRLDRIMATLTESDLEKLFSGAPQYFARSEGHCTGAPNPSVAFPFDEELDIRDLTDHVQIEDKAWGGITAWPHLTRDLNRDAAAQKEKEESRKAHFYIRCRERPNMLSCQGLEKGTMGYSAALELAVGDVLDEEQFGFESVGKKSNVIIEARNRMLSNTGLLRRLPEMDILDRLKKNGELYRDNDLRRKKSVDTYKDLFHTFMRPCNTVVDRRDQFGLANQINALIKCLGTSNVWFDFSHVEWRIRLGQILWGSDEGDDLEDRSSIHDAANAGERVEERYWLLMQILVATELLIRLDAITEGEEYGVEAFRPIDVIHFERAATLMVKWSLHLARSWLENIDVAKIEESPPPEPAAPVQNGWLSSLVSKITLHHAEPTQPETKHRYTIKGRHGQRQVDGLTHFAKKLHWPGIDTYEARISENCQNAGDSTATTPLPTSKTTNSKQSSYFGSWDVTSQHDQYLDRAQAQRRKLAAALHASGWLSKSYVFGLILPGESLYHFLMATLLENDNEAMAKLGPFANLCGGFVYSGKSFWSTSCIVGRVIAAGMGSAECMGWISSDIIPVGFGDGWVNVEVEDVAEDMAHLRRKARLWAKKRIEKESSILGDGDEESVLPADFIIPHDNNYSTPPPLVTVNLRSLELLRTENSVQSTPLPTPTPTTTTTNTNTSTAPSLVSYPAKINFSVSIDGEHTVEHSFSLSYDINFVTAHPCTPSHRVRFLKSPSSPTIQQIDVSGEDVFNKHARPAHRTGHPLHKWYNYKVMHISELLQKQHAPLSELLAESSGNPGYTSSRTNSNRVLVVDCITNLFSIPSSPSIERAAPSKYPIVERRGSFPAAAQMHFESRKRQFGSDMEILVRALCAQKGWNAIISRRKRGCLACAIREAGALGWRVIIRVE